MNRRLSLTVLSITLIATLYLGCASVPRTAKIPVRESADDCLVLLPVQFSNNTGQSMIRKYLYEFSGDYGKLPIFMRTGFMVFVVHEPGVVLEKLTSYVPSSEGIGDSSERKYNIQLPYEPGKMVVAPFTFSARLEALGNTFTSYTDVVKTGEDFKKEILLSAESQENAATWK